MTGASYAVPSDEELRDRRGRYSRHLVNGSDRPQRTSRVPSVLAGFIPELERIAGERAAALDAEATLNGKHVAWQQRATLAQAQYADALKAATLSGGEFPPPHVPEPWLGPARPDQWFDDIHSVLEAEELWILDQRADHLIERLTDASQAARAQVAKAEEALRRAQEDLAPFLAAENRLNPPSPGDDAAKQLDERTVDPRVIRRESGERDILDAWENRYPPRSRLDGRR